MDFLAINDDFKGAAARRDEGERANVLFEFKNFLRQTDGMRLVISSRAIFNSHVECHSGATLIRCPFQVKRLGSRHFVTIAELLNP